MELILPQDFQWRTTLLTPCFGTSSLQNCMTIDSYCFKPHRLRFSQQPWETSLSSMRAVLC